MGEKKRKAERLGDGPIEPEFRMHMHALAAAIDELLNPGSEPGKPGKREVGFCLMMFKLGDGPGRTNYISNCNRQDVIVLLKEQLARFEGQPEITGRA